MDFQQRFKGRMATLKKEGIDGIISTGGIPVKSFCNTPLRTNPNLSFQISSTQEDEVTLPQKLNESQFPSIKNSPRQEIRNTTQINTSGLDPPTPMRSMDLYAVTPLNIRHRKKAMSNPQPPNRSMISGDGKASPLGIANDQRCSFMLAVQRAARDESLPNINSQSLVVYGGDFEPIHPKVIRNEEWIQGYQGLQEKGPRSLLLKESSGQGSISENVQEEQGDMSPKLRKLWSLGSRRRDLDKRFTSLQAQSGLQNKLATIKQQPNNSTIVKDSPTSNASIFGRLIRAKMQRLNDNSYKMEKTLNQDIRSQTPSKPLERVQQSPLSFIDRNERGEGINKQFPRSYGLFNKERIDNTKYLILPNVKEKLSGPRF